MEKTTITVPKGLKEKLETLKIHRREPYFEVIKRLIEEKERSERNM